MRCHDVDRNPILIDLVSVSVSSRRRHRIRPGLQVQINGVMKLVLLLVLVGVDRPPSLRASRRRRRGYRPTTPAVQRQIADGARGARDGRR